jgi:hypothetical protein
LRLDLVITGSPLIIIVCGSRYTPVPTLIPLVKNPLLLTFKFPFTSNFSDGELVPIPTLPSFFIVNLTDPSETFSEVKNTISPP